MPGSTPASALAEPPTRTGFSLFARRFLHTPRGVVGLVLTTLLVGTALFADQIAPGNPIDLHEPALLAPSRAHPMGTDNLGREMSVAVIHGIRTSIMVTFWVVLIAAIVGILIGTVAGYRRGVADNLLMRLTEFFQVVPRFFLALLVASLFGRDMRNLVILLGLTSWTVLARVVRAETLSLREVGFVEAARGYGASSARIIRRHILPGVLPSTVVMLALMASRVILIEASLSFLGLGDPKQIGLGYLTANANAYIDQAWWLSVFPGAALTLGVLGFNLLGDGLNDALRTNRDRTEE